MKFLVKVVACLWVYGWRRTMRIVFKGTSVPMVITAKP